MNYKRLNQVPVWMHAMGVNHAVICPGSRSAPLALSFSRYGKITCTMVADERSAGFVALGIAQQTCKPVVLICTSGTALLNFYPAVAEAFYRQIPLIVLSADRPVEWRDRLDGQTIRQEAVFREHTRMYTDASPYDYQFKSSKKVNNTWLDFEYRIKSMVEDTLDPFPGPVHINFPFAEPFYPEGKFAYPVNRPRLYSEKYPNEPRPKGKNIEELFYNNPLLVVGQHLPDEEFQQQVSALAEQLQCPIIADVASNFHHPNCISAAELILRNDTDQALAPDLLVSCGGAFTSKVVKKYLQSITTKKHIRIYPDPQMGEPFGNKTKEFTFMEFPVIPKRKGREYLNTWKEREHLAQKVFSGFANTVDYSEMKAAEQVLAKLPDGCTLHLANSMPIRWGSIFGVKPGVAVYSNRGTSGIEGCTSTAVGSAMTGDGIHVLLTGDMGFFYDINALWQEQLPPNLKIVVLNNGGGGIFRLIDGPNQQPELERMFAMAHSRTCQPVAAMFGLGYAAAHSLDELAAGMDKLITSESISLLEVFVEAEQSGKVFESYRQIAV